MRLLATVALAIVIPALLAAQAPPVPMPPAGARLPVRDAVGPVPTGTGRIRGRVVQSGTTTPLRRAQITLTGEQNLSRIVTTDGEGRYEISDLPAGRFTLTAAKGGFVTTPFGQRRPFEPGRPVVLGDAQVLTQVDIGLPRGGVIVGRVLDRSGEPVVGADIAVERYQYGPDGQRRLTRVPTAAGGIGAIGTDDLGAFRAFGLTPGEYVVSANARLRPPLPGTAATGAPAVGNLQTYFPGTPNAADAQPIVLEAGEEATVQFSMVSGRFANVSGTILDSSGRPAVGAGLSLASGTSSRGSGSAAADGTFTITRVPPGEHFIQVNLTPRPGGVAAPEVASVPITASGENLEGLQIMTAPAIVASGRVEWDGNAPRTGAPVGLRIGTTPADGRPPVFLFGASDPSATGIVGPDNAFRIGGLSGTVRMTPTGIPPLWTLKAIFAGDNDVTNGSVDTATLVDVPLRVVLTDKTTEITGSVKDARGAPVTEFVVVILPEEPMEGAAATRYTRAIRADAKGTFQVRALPAGRYIITAVPGLEPGSEWDPAFQASVRNGARRFALEDGQSITLSVDLLQ
jgi:hypothetical protein